MSYNSFHAFLIHIMLFYNTICILPISELSASLAINGCISARSTCNHTNIGFLTAGAIIYTLNAAIALFYNYVFDLSFTCTCIGPQKFRSNPLTNFFNYTRIFMPLIY